MRQQLLRCLNPESIAVIGGREVERVVFQCQKMGYGGHLWAVNPNRSTLGGLSSLPDIGSLPGVPDAAFVAIPADSSVEAVRQLSAMGVGGAVCYASGFKEVGAHDRHRRLLGAAGDMPIFGPNCYGYINAINGAVLWPDQHGMVRCDAGVAIFSASGNISINLTMQQRGLSLALMVSIGNQAMVGVEELLHVVLEDDRITAVGLLIEGLRDLPAFSEVARQAAERGKPVVVLKNGRSTVGATIAKSHTATLAGESQLYDTLFKRLGVAEVHDLETFLETLKILSVCGPIKGNRIASMSCSGGEASMVADLAESFNLTFPHLKETHRKQVASTLNQYVSVDNPLDYHTFIWGDFSAMENTFTMMMRGGFDLTILVLDYPCTNDCDTTEWLEAGRAFARSVRASGYPGAVVVSMAENMTVSITQELAGYGIPVLLGIPQALGAIEAASQVGRLQYPLPKLPRVGPGNGGHSGNLETMHEFDAKAVLAKHGISVPHGMVVENLDEAVNGAKSIGFPVAIKIVSKGMVHKSDHGGVRVGLKNSKDVRHQAKDLFSIADRILVEKMVCRGVVELLLGVVRDPQFGHYYIIGTGGVLVELLADRALLLPPLSETMIREAIQTLKIAPLLDGYRGGGSADIEAVVRSMMAFERLVTESNGELVEAEINPLVVAPKGFGAVAVDALMIFNSCSVDRLDHAC